MESAKAECLQLAACKAIAFWQTASDGWVLLDSADTRDRDDRKFSFFAHVWVPSNSCFNVIVKQWSTHPSTSCYQGNGKGATDVDIVGSNHGHGDCRNDVASADACKDLCLQSRGCEAVVHFYSFCCARKDVNLALCDTGGPYTTYIYQ